MHISVFLIQLNVLNSYEFDMSGACAVLTNSYVSLKNSWNNKELFFMAAAYCLPRVGQVVFECVCVFGLTQTCC